MRNAVLIAAGLLVLLAIAVWRPLLPSTGDSPPAAASPPPPPAIALRQPAAAGPAAATLTARARQQLDRDPAAALSDIEHADRLAGARDEQRRALEIVALVRLGRVGHARALADRFYRAFPASPQIPQLERLTGYHPRPYAP